MPSSRLARAPSANAIRGRLVTSAAAAKRDLKPPPVMVPDDGTFDFDMFTIGAGSGGVSSSRRAAEHGARVAVAEDMRIGGTCVIRGCVPKKLLVYASHFAEDFHDAKGYGWEGMEGAVHDWGVMIANKEAEVTRLEGIYNRLLDGSGVTTFRSRARITGPHTVEVDGKEYKSRIILVAVGGWPVLPPIEGINLAITSNEALALPERPQRILVIGGGYIGVEFAGIFSSLGSAVTLVCRSHRILRGFDNSVRDFLTDEMTKKGVTFKENSQVTLIEKLGNGTRQVTFDDGSKIVVDAILCATGRTPKVNGLGLEAVGVAQNENGSIRVDEWSQSSVPSIFAVGDVTDRVNLTPMAIKEGRGLAETMFNGNPMSPDHSDVPAAVFSQPPIGTCGLTEEEAAESHDRVHVYVSEFRGMKHTLGGRQERTLMKIIVDAESDVVLGCHMVGADAPEIIQGLGIAIKCRATKADFDATVGIHPSAAEEFVTMRSPVRTVGRKA